MSEPIYIPKDTVKILVTKEVSGADVRYVVLCVLPNYMHTRCIFYPNTQEEAKALHTQLLAFGVETRVPEEGALICYQYKPAASIEVIE